MRASDVWALGMSFYTLLKGAVPPACAREDELEASGVSRRVRRDLLLAYVANLHRAVPPPGPGSVYAPDPGVDDTVRAMLAHAWTERVTAADALRALQRSV